MIFKTPFSPRDERATSNRAKSDSDAGGIVVLMMALVFVPIVVAHAAVTWPAQFGAQQLAAIVNLVLRTF